MLLPQLWRWLHIRVRMRHQMWPAMAVLLGVIASVVIAAEPEASHYGEVGCDSVQPGPVVGA